MDEQVGDRGRSVGDVLEVVQHEQELEVAQVLLHGVLRTPTWAIAAWDEPRVAERAERNPEDAVPEALGDVGRELQREPRLPDAPGADEREQPIAARRSSRPRRAPAPDR